MNRFLLPAGVSLADLRGVRGEAYLLASKRGTTWKAINTLESCIMQETEPDCFDVTFVFFSTGVKLVEVKMRVLREDGRFKLYGAMTDQVINPPRA